MIALSEEIRGLGSMSRMYVLRVWLGGNVDGDDAIGAGVGGTPRTASINLCNQITRAPLPRNIS